jgi:hypothetical protein
LAASASSWAGGRRRTGTPHTQPCQRTTHHAHTRRKRKWSVREGGRGLPRSAARRSGSTTTTTSLPLPWCCQPPTPSLPFPPWPLRRPPAAR